MVRISDSFLLQPVRHDLRHIADLDLASVRLRGVGEHRQAERTTDHQRARTGGFGFCQPRLADARRAVLLFLPHLRAPCPAAE